MKTFAIGGMCLLIGFTIGAGTVKYALKAKSYDKTEEICLEFNKVGHTYLFLPTVTPEKSQEIYEKVQYESGRCLGSYELIEKVF